MKKTDVIKDLKRCGDYIQNGYFSLADFGNYVLSASKNYEIDSFEKQELNTIASTITERRTANGKRENDEEVISDLHRLLANPTKDRVQFAVNLIYNNPLWRAIDVLSMLVDNGYITALEVVDKAFESHNLELLMRISMVIRGVNYGRIAHFFSESKDPIYIFQYARIISYLPLDGVIRKTMIEDLYNGMKACNFPRYMGYFNKFVKGAPSSDIAREILKSDDVNTIFYYMRDNKEQIEPEMLRMFAARIIELDGALFASYLYDNNIITLSEYLDGLVYSVVTPEHCTRLRAFAKKYESELTEIHFQALEEGVDDPFELIAMGLMETGQIREMIGFASDFELAPYQMIIDFIADKIDPEKLIDVIKLGDYRCIEYAVERIICEWNIKLVNAAMECVEDSELLEKLNNAAVIISYGLPNNKRKLVRAS